MEGSTAVPIGTCPLERIHAEAYSVPTESPESDGTLEWSRTTIVVVEVEASGRFGVGYTYSSSGAADLIDNAISEAVLGGNVLAPSELSSRARSSLRNQGAQGVAATAVSAVDVALWDLKAKLLDLPLVDLLGGHRREIPVYGSGGFTSYRDEELEAQFQGWLDAGISCFKMKVGRHPERDVARVSHAREVVGSGAELYVDANSAYTPVQAQDFARRFAAAAEVTWLEEPLDPEDLAGLRFLRGRMPPGMEIAEGEYGYDLAHFRRLLEEDACDVVMPDATRCGGITGFLEAAVLCRAWFKPVSAHCAPMLHAIIASAAPSVRHIEYFHDHARIEAMLFEGAPAISDGCLVPQRERPGAGWAFRKDEAARFAA